MKPYPRLMPGDTNMHDQDIQVSKGATNTLKSYMRA